MRSSAAASDHTHTPVELSVRRRLSSVPQTRAARSAPAVWGGPPCEVHTAWNCVLCMGELRTGRGVCSTDTSPCEVHAVLASERASVSGARTGCNGDGGGGCPTHLSVSCLLCKQRVILPVRGKE
jgi:hypothetical protein